MTRFTLHILTLIFIITGACSGRKNKLDHSNMIPEKDLISILTDVHIADGLLSVRKIRNQYSALDSLAAYIQIIENHGYTKEAMDKTMKYYFIKNPEKLVSIYDKVLGILSEMESHFEKEFMLEEARKRNLWKGKDTYFFPGSYGTDTAMVRMSLTSSGVYSFSFTALLYSDDQALNPRFISYTCHPDSLETGKKYNLQTIKYFKDSQPHDYKISIRLPNNTPTTFTGLMFVFDNNPAEIHQHALIENITLVLISKTAL